MKVVRNWNKKSWKNPKCQTEYSLYDNIVECSFNTVISCNECRYSGWGKKKPDAKKNLRK